MMKPDVMYRNIYDGHISLKEFERWLKLELDKAYQSGMNDALDEDGYDEISKSQYD